MTKEEFLKRGADFIAGLEEMDRLAADAEKLGDDQKAKELTEAMEGAVNGIVRKMRGEVSFRRVR
mgnify:CR=1 FL=1